MLFGEPPRVTRIATIHARETERSLWMGGTESLLGEPLHPAALARALVVDCAGDLPRYLREQALLYVPCVFNDLDVPPAALPRLESLATHLATILRGDMTPEATGAVARVYILCQAGMNRSGLLTGLVLRALGEESATAIARIRTARPGALNNAAFVHIIEAWRPGES